MISKFDIKRSGIDPLLAREWNRMARLVEGLCKFSVSPPLMMSKSQSGTALSLISGRKGLFFIGRIVNDGPGAPGNYTDQRYWVKEQEITNVDAAANDITWGDLTNGLWVTATNLAEVISESHDFPDNDNYRVMVYRVWDQSPIARYVFTSLPIVVD